MLALRLRGERGAQIAGAQIDELGQMVAVQFELGRDLLAFGDVPDEPDHRRPAEVARPRRDELEDDPVRAALAQETHFVGPWRLRAAAHAQGEALRSRAAATPWR